jgi:hypothetical protein
MSDFATVDDIEASWRPLSSDELDRAEKLLVYASQRIRNRVPGIDDAIDSGAVDVISVEMVAVAMVKRAMLSSDREGVTQTTEGAGPFSQGATYANPLGNLYMTDEEVRELGGNPSAGRARNLRLLGGYC